MICGDPAQIQAEISLGSIIVQYLLTIPIIGWIGFQVRNVVRDVKSWIKRRKKTTGNQEEPPK
jgi:hypothetical protein